jgi:hypothetical protein
MTLSFLSLPVIPSLKLTASGLADVDAFQIVPAVIGPAPAEAPREGPPKPGEPR